MLGLKKCKVCPKIMQVLTHRGPIKMSAEGFNGYITWRVFENCVIYDVIVYLSINDIHVMVNIALINMQYARMDIFFKI